MGLTKVDDRGVTYPLDLLDNEKIRFGTANDLELYQDGTHSYIKNNVGGGNLVLQNYAAGDLLIRSNAAGTLKIQSIPGEQSIIANANGNVELYFDNSKKLETTSTGINVTGGIRLGGNNAANECSDYEEGTFTLTPTTGTCASDYARYVKIGSLVTLIFDVSDFSDSSSSNHLQLTGLPFAIVSPEESSGACHGERLNTTLLVAWIDPGNQRIGFRGGLGSSNYSYITYSNITDGTDCNIKTTMTYTTAS